MPSMTALSAAESGASCASLRVNGFAGAEIMRLAAYHAKAAKISSTAFSWLP
jgi:hypothetical protein